jgi:hypothetical protein
MLAAILLPSLLAAGAEPPSDAVKLNEPRVQMRNNEASATRSPWIDANGWRILRSPDKTFVYRVKGEAAALAAAEAFTYGTAALISTDAPGTNAFAKMFDFLKTIPSIELPPAADFGVVDDGSDATGELLNLLTRMNLLYRTAKNSDPKFHVNVRVDPKEQNPSLAAHKIRSDLGDDNRSLRLYGSEVVVARLLSTPRQARVLLINYSARPVLGLRVRIRGAYSKGEARVSGSDSHLTDLTQDGPATEFTIPDLRTLAVIDLSSN